VSVPRHFHNSQLHYTSTCNLHHPLDRTPHRQFPCNGQCLVRHRMLSTKNYRYPDTTHQGGSLFHKGQKQHQCSRFRLVVQQRVGRLTTFPQPSMLILLFLFSYVFFLLFVCFFPKINKQCKRHRSGNHKTQKNQLPRP
jgi:hypothetical protein